MKIVPMTIQHIPALTALEAVCFSAPWTEDGFAEELQNPNAHFLVAEAVDQVYGYIGVQEICGEGYIANVAVFPQYRQTGVASALLTAAIKGAKQRGCAFLTLEVRESNSAAIRLYTRFGFRCVGTRKAFYRDPKEDAKLYTLYFEEPTC